MIEDSFDVTDEMKQWAKEHFDSMGVGGIWSPEGAGLTYKKENDDSWKIVRKMNHSTVEENHMRFTSLMMSVGINMIEGDALEYEPPASPEEAYAQETSHKIEIAKSWACMCGLKLMDMDLTKGIPIFVAMKEVLMEDGETHEVEVWAYDQTCECGEAVSIDPDDYHLMAGDELFMRYRNSEGTINQAMTRRQMMQLGDEGGLGVLVGTSDPDTDEKVPPWMWGTYCMAIDEGERCMECDSTNLEHVETIGLVCNDCAAREEE
jgi:hypothetical protein